MSDAQIRQNPQIINVPMAISAQTVNYNLPGLDGQNLKLDGPTLAGIYTGKIRPWDDQAIAALNPGVKLPHNEIVPIHRSEGSGDTFIFTQYLTFTTPNPGRTTWASARRSPGPRCRAGSTPTAIPAWSRRSQRDALFDRLCRRQLPRRYREGRESARRRSRAIPANSCCRRRSRSRPPPPRLGPARRPTSA